MNFPDIDEMFMNEMNNHNNTIAMTSDLQSLIVILMQYGVNINAVISDVLGSIQKKEYDKSAQIFKDAIYSIDTLISELVIVSNSVKQGVSKIYDQESKGF